MNPFFPWSLIFKYLTSCCASRLKNKSSFGDYPWVSCRDPSLTKVTEQSNYHKCEWIARYVEAPLDSINYSHGCHNYMIIGPDTCNSLGTSGTEESEFKNQRHLKRRNKGGQESWQEKRMEQVKEIEEGK